MKRSLHAAILPVSFLVVFWLLDLIFPSVFNAYFQSIIIYSGINVILAVSLNLVNGFTGQFSIGHAGFMALGAYASAMFSLHFGTGWAAALASSGVPPVMGQGFALLVALLIGGLLAAFAGLLVGLP